MRRAVLGFLFLALVGCKTSPLAAPCPAPAPAVTSPAPKPAPRTVTTPDGVITECEGDRCRLVPTDEFHFGARANPAEAEKVPMSTEVKHWYCSTDFAAGFLVAAALTGLVALLFSLRPKGGL